VGNVPGGVPFPSLSYALEETPAEEYVDDAEESILRERIFGVTEPPPVDFSPDIDPIEVGNVRTVTLSKIIPSSLTLIMRARPLPEDVGILAIEVYIPRRVR
jgi:hypothetical protein